MQLPLWTDSAAVAALRPPCGRRTARAAGARQNAFEPEPRPAAALPLDALGARADCYVEETHAHNTNRAYRSDWAAFER